MWQMQLGVNYIAVFIDQVIPIQKKRIEIKIMTSNKKLQNHPF